MLNSFFIVVREGARFERLHVVTVPRLVIGRGHECALRLSDTAVSRTHALLEQTTTGLLIRDLGSRNGTLLNGRPVEHERDQEVIEASDVLIKPYHLRIFFEPAHVERDIAPSEDSTESLSIFAVVESDVERMEQRLTPKERLVYHALLQGLARKEIANLLGMKTGTVRTHAKSIFKTFQVESQPLLMAKCHDRR